MYLSDRDLEYAVQLGHLIVTPPPKEYDTTSIDLHLDKIETAGVWNWQAYEREQKEAGHELPVLHVGAFNHRAFANRFQLPVPSDTNEKVFRDGSLIILKPSGFFLWQTLEVVGTPEENPQYICFIDGKSTKATASLHSAATCTGLVDAVSVLDVKPHRYMVRYSTISKRSSAMERLLSVRNKDKRTKKHTQRPRLHFVPIVSLNAGEAPCTPGSAAAAPWMVRSKVPGAASALAVNSISAEV